MAKPRVPAPAASSTTDSISVAVRVRPGAGRTRVGGRYDGPHGPALIIAVGAPAVEGKATEAVRRALAEALGVRRADVTLRIGATSRNKVFTIAAVSRPSGAPAVESHPHGTSAVPPASADGVTAADLGRRVAGLLDGVG
jgi:uncharacterized protein YggU (UPF0235/DUF167 family)